jgi:hypothetical protein
MALRILLVLMGGLLAIASRTSAGIRRAITRDLVVEISSDDGVAHHYVFRDRRVSSHAGSAPVPDCVLRFATAAQGVRALVSRHTVSHLVAGLLEGTISVRGNAFQLLWFAELTQQVLPIAARVPWATPPGAYVAPNPALAAAKRITREPALAALDPTWADAARARAKLTMMRVAAGEPTKEF